MEKGHSLEGFIRSIEDKLKGRSPIVPLIITRQLTRLGATRKNLPDSKALEFIENTYRAFILGLGPEFAEEAKRMMRNELRKWRPSLFRL